MSIGTKFVNIIELVVEKELNRAEISLKQDNLIKRLVHIRGIRKVILFQFFHSKKKDYKKWLFI